MATSPVVEGLVYSLYAFLAYTEVMVLIASAVAVFAFVAWQVIKKIRSLTDAAIDAASLTPDGREVGSPEPAEPSGSLAPDAVDDGDDGSNGAPPPRSTSPLRVTRPSGRTPPPKGRRPRPGQ